MLADKLRSENLVDLLSCPQCGGHDFNLNPVQFQCNSCLISYSTFDSRHFANNFIPSICFAHIKEIFDVVVAFQNFIHIRSLLKTNLTW